jgi:hypothetical protein
LRRPTWATLNSARLSSITSAAGDVTEAEKTKFLHALPTPGTFVSDSLLSTSVRPDDGSARHAGITAATCGLAASQPLSLRCATTSCG